MEQLADATSGGLAGMISTATVYPLEVIKTNMQAQKQRTTPGGRPPRTVTQLVRDLLERDGLGGLYGGCHVAALQAFLEKFIYFCARRKARSFTARARPYFAATKTFARECARSRARPRPRLP
jgi:hypothetical protein